jgi:YgiT-type zinc finger domain-containing protein
MKRKKALDLAGEICALCCEGRLEAQRGREYFRYGPSLVIIDDVPAWVCNKCGERYHHARVYKKMRQIAAHSDQLTERVSIPVAHYELEGEAD